MRCILVIFFVGLFAVLASGGLMKRDPQDDKRPRIRPGKKDDTNFFQNDQELEDYSDAENDWSQALEAASAANKIPGKFSDTLPRPGRKRSFAEESSFIRGPPQGFVRPGRKRRSLEA